MLASFAVVLQLHKCNSVHVQVGKHSGVGSLLLERNSQAQSPTLGETALYLGASAGKLSRCPKKLPCATSSYKQAFGLALVA